MYLLMRWLILSFSIALVPYVIPGVQVDSLWAASLAGFVLGVFNLVLKPVLILLTFPLTLFTFGFFLLILNGILFYWMGSLVSGVYVSSFSAAFFASLFVSFLSWLFQSMTVQKHEGRWVWVRHRFDKPPSQRNEKVIELHQTKDGEWK